MKVVFLSPPHENLGIGYLSAALKAAGFETGLVIDPLLFDEPGFLRSPLLGRVFSARKSVLARLIAARPDLVCFSVTTDYYAWAKSWASEVKRRLDVPVVFGGIHPTSVPEKVVLEDCVDYVCVGEGDEALAELARAIRDRADASRIRNIWLRRRGRIVSNPLRPPIADLDSLPFPDKELFRSSYPIFDSGYLASTGRGCPFSCAYCCNSVYDALYAPKRFMRRRSVSHVLAELELAVSRYRPEFVHFADEVFNHDGRWLEDFLPRYRKTVGLPFSCYVFPDFVTKAQALGLKAAGCFKVQLGLQVIDEAARSGIFHRPSKNENIARAIQEFRSAGVYVAVDHIFGLPGETEQDLASLLEFHEQSMPDSNEIFFLRCYPRSALTRWAVENGHMDAATLQAIEDGAVQSGLFGGPDIAADRSYARRTAMLLGIYPKLPRWARRMILKFRLFHLAPPLPRIPSLIAMRLCNRPKYDFNALRALRRFVYFMGGGLIP
ncbi:MAG TPA: hypothetical protein DEB40_14460 [Elusimicrobia bacterium]|nr:hypothetical protein [Elusimicrobiota bacterium]HBT62936.1 hypothetical protein [Elusimicrobiota bacterium]